MPAKLQVQLGNGEDPVVCSVVENLGFRHDIGMYAKWVEYNGKEFMAVRPRGPFPWRKWSAADRTRPLREHLERKAAVQE